MKKRVHAGIIAGMCAVIAITMISLVQGVDERADEPTDDLPDEILILNVAVPALAFYIIFLYLKSQNLRFTLTGLKPSSTSKEQNPSPDFLGIQKFVNKLFPICLILVAVIGVIVVISILIDTINS